jgi:tRNA(Ile)-lysidine synthase TilS/MesJ
MAASRAVKAAPISVEAFHQALKGVSSIVRGRIGKVVSDFRAKGVGVAVSGGSDSMGLCVLLRKHQEEYGWPQEVVAYTIDHGVRAGSNGEAKTVGKIVKNQLSAFLYEAKS